jgi:diadenosine tetraphosphate (Ap4A) HIT family hydrolase
VPEGADVTEFALDPRIAGDSIPVADLGLCSVRLAGDANYPWLIMVPRRADAVEIIDFAPADRAALMEEIAAVSRALKDTVPCDKLNIAALGNAVRQLHVHVIARRTGDPAGTNPIWGHAPPRRYAGGEAEALAARIAARLKQHHIKQDA